MSYPQFSGPYIVTGDAQDFIKAFGWNQYDEHVKEWRWYWYIRGRIIYKPRSVSP